MSATIFLEGRELQTAARQMSSIINSMNNIQSAISQIHGTMSSTWQGRASNQNAQLVQALQTATREYLTDARGTKEALDLAVAEYDRIEGQQVTNVSNLNTRGIF